MTIAVLATRVHAQDSKAPGSPTLDKTVIQEVMLFGATGTIGDGILKALLTDPAVRMVHVITRRKTKRITTGAAAGKVQVIQHLNYLDYAALKKRLQRTTTVYWALGTSASNVDDKQYTEIHVHFPVAFVKAWMSSNKKPGKSFHLITGAGTSRDSWFHWAREKAKAEQELFALARRGGPQVYAYRPAFILAAKERAGWFKNTFSPLLGAIRTTHIGQCMIEITMRSKEIPSGRIFEHGELKRFAAIYRKRRALGQ